jgi:hypothetical protein
MARANFSSGANHGRRTQIEILHYGVPSRSASGEKRMGGFSATVYFAFPDKIVGRVVKVGAR